ncbi:PadR family transcriptional regulator [Marinobacter caseinilyticus]|uniref:PadR family transcriptional regulator n=1 Tax=Marinobacter caseinilyticus TaxID=2692195 RepID=UPI00140D155A|nr:PadR family transcriptional regulator [Marinobacter caseinilyticus]
MALRYALLCALHEQPATGYELTQRFKTRLANVWNASHQQVYRELAKLQQEKLLLVEAIEQPNKPDKKRYHTTLAGRSALEHWLGQIQPRPATRDPLLVKLFAGDLLDLAVLHNELEALKKESLAQLEYYRVIEQTYFPNPGTLSRHYRLQYLALRRGILSAEANLNWLAEAEVTLQNLPNVPGRP